MAFCIADGRLADTFRGQVQKVLVYMSLTLLTMLERQTVMWLTLYIWHTVGIGRMFNIWELAFAILFGRMRGIR